MTAVVHRLGGIAAAAASLALVLGGCARAETTPDPVVVFGAASLNKAFTEIARRFEIDNPGAVVEFTFAGSADLLSQLAHGAPADVLATADTATMDRAVQAGLVSGAPVDFAANTLTIVVAPGNPKRIASLTDLARPDLAVAVCAPQVPCGAATVKAAKAVGVALSPVSEESQVTDVLTKVTSGQADAGVVYVTDAAAAGDTVTALAIPGSPVNRYPIAVARDSRHPDLARRFVDAVTGPAGRKILAEAGFAGP